MVQTRTTDCGNSLRRHWLHGKRTNGRTGTARGDPDGILKLLTAIRQQKTRLVHKHQPGNPRRHCYPCQGAANGRGGLYLPEPHLQQAPNASKHSFLPYLFSCERKDRAAGGTSETASTERAAAIHGVSYPLSPFPPHSRRTASLGLPGMLESHSCTNAKNAAPRMLRL